MRAGAFSAVKRPSPVATQTSALKMPQAMSMCSMSLTGATAVMPGLSPEATMIQPTVACSPPAAPMATMVKNRRPRTCPRQAK